MSCSVQDAETESTLTQMRRASRYQQGNIHLHACKLCNEAIHACMEWPCRHRACELCGLKLHGYDSNSALTLDRAGIAVAVEVVDRGVLEELRVAGSHAAVVGPGVAAFHVRMGAGIGWAGEVGLPGCIAGCWDMRGECICMLLPRLTDSFASACLWAGHWQALAPAVDLVKLLGLHLAAQVGARALEHGLPVQEVLSVLDLRHENVCMLEKHPRVRSTLRVGSRRWTVRMFTLSRSSLGSQNWLHWPATPFLNITSTLALCITARPRNAAATTGRSCEPLCLRGTFAAGCTPAAGADEPRLTAMAGFEGRRTAVTIHCPPPAPCTALYFAGRVALLWGSYANSTVCFTTSPMMAISLLARAGSPSADSSSLKSQLSREKPWLASTLVSAALASAASGPSLSNDSCAKGLTSPRW